MAQSSNAQRDARLLYLQQKATASQEAAKAPQAISSGPPVAAEPLEEVVVSAQRPSFSEIQTDTRRGEVDFVKQAAIDAVKSTAANLAGLPVDLVNLLNVEKISGRRDFKKGTSEHVKSMIGVDPGSFGDVLGDVNPADGLATGLKVASKAGMLVPIGLWGNRQEAEEVADMVDQMVGQTGMRDIPVGSQHWTELNRQLFERTKGWMLDFNGNLRRWFAPKEGGLNPNIILPDGKITVRQDGKLEELLAPEVWANFDQASVEYLKKIPVRWILDSRGEWSDRKGIGLMMAELYRDPAQFLETLHHEIGHGFDVLAGSGRGGSIINSTGRVAADEKRKTVLSGIAATIKGDPMVAYAMKHHADKIARAKSLGTEVDPDALKKMEHYKKIFGEEAVNNYVKATQEYWDIYKVDYDNYLKISGEVLARAVGRSHDQSKFPLDDVDVDMSDISLMPDRTPKSPRDLPQRQSDTSIMVGDVVTELIQKSEDPRKLEAEIQSGKWDNEIQRIVQEQRADATRDKSRFKDPELNREYEEARRRLGLADPVRPERPERINESFPMTQDRPTLMRPRNTQGARLDDSRGGPPTKYEGFGQMMENAELLATGREEVWKSGRFDIEAFRNKQEKLARQRAVVAAKGSTSQATNKVKLEPKFWAYDPDAGKIAVVTAKAEGGYEIKYKTGKITDAVMDKVDIVTNRQGLNEFISKTLWKKRTGEPITYLDPTE